MRERERERVANYLELPNNLMTFLQKSHSCFDPEIHAPNEHEIAAKRYDSLLISPSYLFRNWRKGRILFRIDQKIKEIKFKTHGFICN